MRHDKAFKIVLIALFPALWLFAKIAPKIFVVASQGDDFLRLYLNFFNRAPEDVQTAIIVAPAWFIGGRILYWLYKVYIYKEKVETPQEMKKRVFSEHGITDPF